MPFANYQEMYRQKLTTADEAVKVIKSGDWVDYGFCACLLYTSPSPRD